MKQASLHFALLLLLLLTATTAHTQLMRKDTAATLPHSKWEVGLDLKPIWDKSEPYNFVVRYFFKEKWALRGGLGLELNWSNDTLDVVERKLTEPDPTLRYELYESQESKYSNLQVFLGIQYEQGKGKLRWYYATDIFYLRNKYYYNVPFATNGRDELTTVVPEFARIVSQENIKNGGGIRVINGFGYQLLPNVSISSEIAVLAQGFKYKNWKYTDDYSVYDNETFKITREEGWNYSVKIEPLFRVFLNYHFFKN